MLRQLTYKFTALLLLILFLAASTGLSIYIHKCACEQRVIATLFVEHKCHEEQFSSCCSVKEENETNYSDADASCGCKTEHFTIKVNELFNSTNPITISQKVELTATYQFIYQDHPSNYTHEYYTNTNLYIPDDSPPIKPVGRILVYRLHQSKTPDFIS